MRPLAAVLLLALPALAADPDQEKPPTLDEQIKFADLSEGEVKALKEYGFVVGGTEYKQVFTPYIKGHTPLFVTADSLLNAFHVLFEESVFRLEQANARKLPLILSDIEKRLPAAEKALAGDADLLKKATARAQVFLGVARALFDPKAGPEDETLRKLVTAEVERVTAAKGAEKPAWLGPPDKGFMALDYSRFEPRGFYTRSHGMERYFRAVSWLQAIPWRLDNDEEYAAILLLAKAYELARDQKEWVGWHFWERFDEFLGCGDDWNLPEARYHLPKALAAEALATSRNEARKRATEKGGPQINDQLRFQPNTPDGKPEPQFRFVSAYRLPDAVLFQRISDKRMPSGLDVAAAFGSPFARGRLKKDSPEVLKAIDGNAVLFAKSDRRREQSVYADYLNCLRVLVERTEPDAPKLFTSDAWAGKTCQTALGGWAQMRHTWVLQAKESVHYVSAAWREAGFVEPVPEFYADFAALVERCQKLFADAGALDPEAPADVSDDDAVVAFLAIRKTWSKGLAALDGDQRKVLGKFVPRLPETGDPNTDASLARALDDAAATAAAVIVAEQREVHDREWESPPPEPKECWAKLASVCTTLEKLANKQLRGVEFRAEEHQFLKSYGPTLAKVMFYGGNSYLHPQDDAPRIVDVHSQRGQVREVGIGRPRVIWVVYPWKGNDVLCRGAVLSYHEFASPDRLTDNEWLKLLDSPKAPEQPEWVKGWTVPREKVKEK